jgi:hypothetical protein
MLGCDASGSSSRQRSVVRITFARNVFVADFSSDAAWENHQEWTTRYEELGGLTRPQTDVLMLLRTAAVAQTPADPRRDPAWSYTLFEREFERIPE